MYRVATTERQNVSAPWSCTSAPAPLAVPDEALAARSRAYASSGSEPFRRSGRPPTGSSSRASASAAPIQAFELPGVPLERTRLRAELEQGRGELRAQSQFESVSRSRQRRSTSSTCAAASWRSPARQDETRHPRALGDDLQVFGAEREPGPPRVRQRRPRTCRLARGAPGRGCSELVSRSTSARRSSPWPPRRARPISFEEEAEDALRAHPAREPPRAEPLRELGRLFLCLPGPAQVALIDETRPGSRSRGPPRRSRSDWRCDALLDLGPARTWDPR